jgi:hypothetical protein
MPYTQFQPVAWRNSARFLTASGVTGVVMRFRLAHDLTDLGVLRLGRVRLRLPVSKLAGVAAKAQNPS